MKQAMLVTGLWALSAVVAARVAHAADDPPHDHDHPAHHGPDHNQIQGVRFDVHNSFDTYGMVGFGGRVEFAIVPDGFIRGDVHDELALSFGADVMFGPAIPRYYDGGPYVLPIGVVQWNFYLPGNWSVFPELGVAAHVDFRPNGWKGHKPAYPWPAAGFGVRYHFSKRVGLLMRVSTPAGLQFGMIF